MSTAEIVLLVIGGIIMVLSYVLPARKDKTEEKAPQIDREQIKELLEKEIADAKYRINDIVDETITYSMEKTERSMERLTNEKIMAVNEYSDFVLETINKSHNEIIFLYDMLTDKHDSLLNAVNEAGKASKEIQQVIQYSVDDKSHPKKEESKKEEKPASKELPKKNGQVTILPEIKVEFAPIEPEKVVTKRGTRRKTDANKTKIVGNEKKVKSEAVKSEKGIAEETEDGRRNNNEQILILHKLGKSNAEIAKDLGLGVGEVKLVIDLFKAT